MLTRIGIYGGSFNPVHHGHLMVAAAALEELRLDRLLIVPAARSPFKPDSPLAPAPVRARLLRLAFAGWERCEIDLRELHRGGTSYTVDTLRELRAEHPDAALFYLVGADHLPTLNQWREADVLARLATFVIVPRPGMAEPAEAPSGFRLVRLRGHPIDLSASEIRTRCARGLPIHTLTPPAVAEAIREIGLYLDAT
ncbi:MAG: nicotinate (nicotinamide) nucleotide adenylyltransferase [Verrucomicrobia bacterium]|nr:MAG: nicotinate (nicotinamide) nucleotide adenylyltransferase [Verrucomicrobiota bacterium]